MSRVFPVAATRRPPGVNDAHRPPRRGGSVRHDGTATHAPLVLGSAQLTTTTEPARGMVVVHVTGEVDVANSAPLPDALLDACAATATVAPSST